MMKTFQKLSQEEIEILKTNGCTAENWQLIKVAPGFDAGRVRFTRFSGEIVIGDNSGYVNIDGFQRP